MIPPPPKTTLFPYPTLFRSGDGLHGVGRRDLHRREPSCRRRPHPRRSARADDMSCLGGGLRPPSEPPPRQGLRDRKSKRLNSSHDQIPYAVFCLNKQDTNIR